MASFNNSHEFIRFFRGLPSHSQPKESPRTYEEYIRAYGVNRHDTFITDYQDRSARDPAVSSFEDLTAERVVLVLTREYEQPGRLAELRLPAPHVPHLVAYLFLQACLPNRTDGHPYSPPLVLAKEYSNSHGLFSPISSPKWTTSEEWQGDKLALVFPRQAIYKLLLQTVREDLCNSALAAETDTWLDSVVKIFPEDRDLRHPTIHASHEYLLHRHESEEPLDESASENRRSPTPEDLPEWPFNDVLQSASAAGPSALAKDENQNSNGEKRGEGSGSARTMFLRSEAELFTRRLRKKSFYNSTGHTRPLV